MKTRCKIKKIKTNNVGKWIVGNTKNETAMQCEESIANLGFKLQPGKGCDIPDWGIEIKTRDINSKSPQTIGSTSLSDLMLYDYDAHPLKDKCLLMIRQYNNGVQIIRERYYDFTDPDIQEKLRKDFNAARAKVLENVYVNKAGVQVPADGWYRGGTYGNFEVKNGVICFRLGPKAYRVIERMAENSSTYNKYFAS